MMKTVKFKKIRLTKQKKTFLIIIASIMIIFLECKSIIKFININIHDYLYSKVKKENTIILKNAFLHSRGKDIDVENLMRVTKNSKDEIVEVDFNIPECSKILYEITDYINEKMNDYNYLGYSIDVPLGFLTKSPFFMNVGPKIPVKIEIGDTALGNVRTEIKSFGINNALLELYVDIYIDTAIIYPFQVTNERTEYKTLIASKVITGSIPSFYNGAIYSQSEAIDLPMNTKM